MKWLRQPKVENVSLKKFIKDAYIKEQPHSVLLWGVPIILDLSNQAHL